MQDPPWKAHHTPRIEDLEAAIASQFPTVCARGLRHLGSGWEFDAYQTSDGWVFRFPRRTEAPSQLRRELLFLDLVRPALAPEVAVPRVELIGAPGPHFPFVFAGHRVVEGIPADDPGAPPHPDLPRQLGRALSRVHSIPPEAARAAGARIDEAPGLAWLEEARQVAPTLGDDSPEVHAAVEWLLREARAPMRYSGPLRFVHNDLCPDHVLVSRRTGALTGLLDWTDAALGDPVVDFVFLATWGGWPLVESVLGFYEPPVDEGFTERLRFLARTCALVWLGEAVERGGDVAKHLGWLVNALATG